MKRDDWKRILLGALALLGQLVAGAEPGEKPKPNVVFMVADDLGWRDTGCYGRKEWNTPNIDKLAASGCRFTQAYAMPVCSPTRTMIVTGRHCVRQGVTDWWPGYPAPPNSRIQTPTMKPVIPDLGLGTPFVTGGYATCHIGKWHTMGSPAKLGFQQSLLTDVFHGPTEQNKAEAAVKFIRENKGQPFFLYLCFSSVHLPLGALPEKIQQHDGAPNPVYAAMADQLDGYVGTVMQALHELQLEQNTLVIFYSDNGGVQLCDGVSRPVTSNLPLRGNKGCLYEGGVRVPLIMSHPPTIKAGSTSDAMISPADFFPTLLEFCRLPSCPKNHIDGISFAGVLRGEPGKRQELQWHYPHFSHHAMGFPAGALRKGEWKLIEWFGQQDEYGRNRIELFHLTKDPGEQNNWADRFPHIRNTMLKELEKWRREVGALLPMPAVATNQPAVRQSQQTGWGSHAWPAELTLLSRTPAWVAHYGASMGAEE